ncbi:MAG TPA: hypothetical protein PK777_01850 [Thermoguttaceae bacterium]|nr:hypothetical protein [Thermoguttaceae bacterium]HPP51664.1 hypothetical protein [Thermoguttaceae bacterium]
MAEYGPSGFFILVSDSVNWGAVHSDDQVVALGLAFRRRTRLRSAAVVPAVRADAVQDHPLFR